MIFKFICKTEQSDDCSFEISQSNENKIKFAIYSRWSPHFADLNKKDVEELIKVLRRLHLEMKDE
jgi:hypothetical protein